MKVADFIAQNDLSAFLKCDDGTYMLFEPNNFMVYGYKIDKVKIKYNRDSCIMHVYLIGSGLMNLGKKFGQLFMQMCELGFKCLVQSYSDSEITIYSADQDSHVYDMEYQTGKSWDELLGW